MSNQAINHEELSELLIVQDHFMIEGRGLLLLPDFPLPEFWENRQEKVIVKVEHRPDLEAMASFEATHFHITPPAPLVYRWRLVIVFAESHKADIPIGAKLFVTEELKSKIFRQTS